MKSGDCIHFTGIQHVSCKAGVEYESLERSPGPGIRKLPCLAATLPGCRTTCPSFRAMTPEEEAAEEELIQKAIKNYLEDWCPECGTPLVVSTSPRSTVKSCPTHGFVGRSCRRVGEF